MLRLERFGADVAQAFADARAGRRDGQEARFGETLSAENRFPEGFRQNGAGLSSEYAVCFAARDVYY